MADWITNRPPPSSLLLLTRAHIFTDPTVNMIMPGLRSTSVHFTFSVCFQMGQIWLPFVRCAKFKRTNVIAILCASVKTTFNQKYLTGGQIWKWGKSISIIIISSTVLSLCFYLCIYEKSTPFALNDMLRITIPTTATATARKSFKSFWTAHETEMASLFVALLLFLLAAVHRIQCDNF